MINVIYDSGNYTEKFELDIVEAEKMILISSPEIRQDKIERLLLLVKGRQETGVRVTVITTDLEDVVYGNPDVCYELISEMQQVGINVVTKAEVEERNVIRIIDRCSADSGSTEYDGQYREIANQIKKLRKKK